MDAIQVCRFGLVGDKERSFGGRPGDGQSTIGDGSAASTVVQAGNRNDIHRNIGNKECAGELEKA